MKALIGSLVALASLAGVNAFAQEGGRGGKMCEATIGTVKYVVYWYGDAGMAAEVDVPGFGTYFLGRGGEPGWLTGDGISVNPFSEPKQLKDVNNGNNKAVVCK